MLAATVFSANIFAAPKPKMSKSKVTMEQAQEIALRRVSGEVEQSDTVTRHKKPAYSFVIKKSNGATTHVLVNENGRIKSVTNEKTSKSKIK